MRSSNPGVDLERLLEKVRHSSFGEARRDLERFARRRGLKRSARAELGAAARLVGLPDLTIQLLRGVVRSGDRLSASATNHELLQYAAALIDLKAYREAKEILRAVDSSREPRAYLFMAWAHFADWAWVDAVPLLERLLSRPRLEESLRLGALVNLSIALLHGRVDIERGERLAKEVVGLTSPSHFRLHHRHALIQLGQTHFFKGRYREAILLLDGVERSVLDAEDEYNRVRLEEWKLLAKLYAAKPRARAPLERQAAAFRDRAARGRHWYAARSMDFYRSLLSGDRPLLDHVYVGSPYPRLRERVRADLACPSGEKPVGLPYVRVLEPDREWALLEDSPAVTALIELRTGRNTLGSHELKEGQLPQKLLAALASDFYAGLRIAGLHEQVCPGEVYHPLYSVDRMHQGIRRLRAWLKAARLPIEIREAEGYYSLGATAPCVLRYDFLPGEPSGGRAALPVRTRERLDRHKSSVGERTFGSGELATALGCSRRLANDLIAGAIRDGLLSRVGSGPATRYRYS